MTTQESTTFIIVGLTREGRKFRPSDWAERLCGVMSAFGADHRMSYSPYVRPGLHQHTGAAQGPLAAFGIGAVGQIGHQPGRALHAVQADILAGKFTVKVDDSQPKSTAK